MTISTASFECSFARASAIALILSSAVLLMAICLSSKDSVSISESPHNGGGRMPLIIWWTDRLYPHLDVKTTTITCALGSCSSTLDRSLRFRPEAIGLIGFIFYGSDMELEDMPLPRLPHHQWALFHEESPLNNFMFSHTKGIRLFNYTATFSRESDYPLTTQFLPTLQYLVQRKPVPLSEKNRLRKDGFAPVIYVQSHCHVPSDRDRYIKELSNYIAIDSYGSCLHNKDLPPEIRSTETFEDGKFLDFISKYKFHLAFENAICDDYITEKLFRALHVGSVPIYKGAPTVKDWLPSNQSAIIVDDFKSPAELAEFVSALDSDDAQYEKYLEFKEWGISNEFLIKQMENREWGVNDLAKIDFFRGFECYVCNEMIRQEESRLKDSEDKLPLRIANKRHMGCPEPHASLEVENLPSNDEWLEQGWPEAYWFSYDQAKAMETMILNNETDSKQIYNVALKMRYSP